MQLAGEKNKNEQPKAGKTLLIAEWIKNKLTGKPLTRQ
jgi:hypothetical protein